MASRVSGPLVLVTPVARNTSELEAEVVTLFDQFRRPLLRYLIGIGLPSHDAEEIVQETFLALFQHLRDSKPRDNLRGWLFRVAHNLGLKRRQLSRRDWDGRADPEIADWAPDPAPSPETQAVYRQDRRRLIAVANALAEQDRRCLFLRAEGLRYREIAGILGMSLGAVSMSLARTLARLARATDRSLL